MLSYAPFLRKTPLPTLLAITFPNLPNHRKRLFCQRYNHPKYGKMRHRSESPLKWRYVKECGFVDKARVFAVVILPTIPH
ncbi:hypothetical protein [Chryseobacterium artocarpi]|uniref:hypothetical protein n=1 Tax=Chryseobacterium artocarpi TaxID=1414727 RepID=UPI003F3B956F